MRNFVFPFDQARHYGEFLNGQCMDINFQKIKLN